MQVIIQVSCGYTLPAVGIGDVNLRISVDEACSVLPNSQGRRFALGV